MSGMALIAGFRKMIRLAAEQEAAEKALAASLRLAGDASAYSMVRMKDFSSALQAITIYGDEALLKLMALGSSMGKLTGGELQDATKAAIGLSEAFGIELVAAMRLVARAAVGDTAQLKRYGIMIDALLPTQEKFNALLEIGAENFALAEARAKTAMGRWTQFWNSAGDAAEKYGMIVINMWDRLRREIGTTPDVSIGMPGKLASKDSGRARLLSLVAESERLEKVWAQARFQERHVKSLRIWNQPLNIRAIIKDAQTRANAAMTQMIALDREIEVLGPRVSYLNEMLDSRPGPGPYYDLFGAVGTGTQRAGQALRETAFDVAFGWRSAFHSLRQYRAELNKRLKKEKEQKAEWKDIGEAMRAATRTPMEEYTLSIDAASDALKHHAIGWKVYGRLVRQARDALEAATRVDAAKRPPMPKAIREGSTEAAIAAYEAANPIKPNTAVTNRLDEANDYAKASRDHLEELVNLAEESGGEDFAP